MKYVGRVMAGFYIVSLVFSVLSLAGCILPGPWHREHHRDHEVRIEVGGDRHFDDHHDEHHDEHR